MIPPPARRFPAPLLIFLLAVAVCAAFAVFTNHRWEDFYITYRSSK
ncbi:MAG: hypothetical protein JWQ62_2666, partial [Lacunisphaera sp.]|nr:hypothetical protein [Lacunisphaera sp.]